MDIIFAGRQAIDGDTADYGIVGDLYKVIPAFMEALDKGII